MKRERDTKGWPTYGGQQIAFFRWRLEGQRWGLGAQREWSHELEPRVTAKTRGVQQKTLPLGTFPLVLVNKRAPALYKASSPLMLRRQSVRSEYLAPTNLIFQNVILQNLCCVVERRFFHTRQNNCCSLLAVHTRQNNCCSLFARLSSISNATTALDTPLEEFPCSPRLMETLNAPYISRCPSNFAPFVYTVHIHTFPPV